MREREVFASIVSGYLNKQVGADLGIAERTVKMHRANVMEKMNAASIAELVHIADLRAQPRPDRVPQVVHAQRPETLGRRFTESFFILGGDCASAL